MKYLFVIALNLWTLHGSLTQAKEAKEAKFNTNFPIGRAFVQKQRHESIYLGYFCLVRETDQNGNFICKFSQFGKGRDLFLGVDFLGNPSQELGTWEAVGPVFDATTGNDFYLKSLSSTTDFSTIWKAIWNKSGYNWSEKPIEIPKSKFDRFIALLSNSESAEKQDTKEECNDKKIGYIISKQEPLRENGFTTIFKPLYCTKDGPKPIAVNNFSENEVCNILGFDHGVKHSQTDLDFDVVQSYKPINSARDHFTPILTYGRTIVDSITCY